MWGLWAFTASVPAAVSLVYASGGQQVLIPGMLKTAGPASLKVPQYQESDLFTVVNLLTAH